MKMLKWFYPLSIFTFLGIIDIKAQQCNPATERASLIDFYNKTNGRNWRLNNWAAVIAANTPVCPTTGNPWSGVKCTSGCVTQLDLRSSGMTNTAGVADIPLLNLQNAQVIDLSNNTLSGQLNSFSFSQKLTKLNLSNNGFTGTVPNFNLPELVDLDVSENW
jgi:hypothetical protein